jgi:hypothetical protein
LVARFASAWAKPLKQEEVVEESGRALFDSAPSLNTWLLHLVKTGVEKDYELRYRKPMPKKAP